MDNDIKLIRILKKAVKKVKFKLDYRGYSVLDAASGNETIEKTILTPNDTTSFFDYLEIYLYDGYHRSANEWYSHTTEEEFNDKTIFTGIKLTSGKNVNQITSDIELTAFSYDKDDFDENRNYKGTSKYSIIVKKK